MKNAQTTITKFEDLTAEEFEYFGRTEHVFQVSRYQDENNFSFEVFGALIVEHYTDDMRGFLCFGIHDPKRMVKIVETADGYALTLDNRAN